MELTAKVCCKNAVFAVVFLVKMLSHFCAHSKWYIHLASTPPSPHTHMHTHGQTDIHTYTACKWTHRTVRMHTHINHVYTHAHTTCLQMETPCHIHAHAHKSCVYPCTHCSGKKMIISLFIFYHVAPRRMCFCCQSSYLHVGSSMILS